MDSPELNTSTPSPPSATHNATTETYGTWTLVSRRKDKNPKSRAHPEPKNQPPNSRNGDSKSTPSPQSPSRGPRDAKRKSPAVHCDTTPHPRPSHPSSEMGHDSAVSSHTSLEQPPPPIAFSFGEPHSPKNSPNIKFSSSPKHAPNPKLILNKHGQRNQLKGKGETIGEPRNTGMGNILQREDHSHLKHHDRRDQSNPNSHHGLVRGRTDEGLEPHFSAHAGEPEEQLSPSLGPSLVQLAQPLVELPNRQAIKKGELDPGLERASLKIKGANLGRLKPTRHSVGEEDVRGQTHNSQHHGRHGRKEDHSSICLDPNFQFGSKSTRMHDGSDGTRSGAQVGRGVQEDSSEGNGMDHDGPDEDSSSN